MTAMAFAWDQDELDTGLGPIAAIVFDYAGKADIAAMLSSMTETEFDKTELEKVLGNEGEPEPWRVGEAIAECYLTHHRACSFPWPDGRDVRKSGSSLPGADLVGLRTDTSGDCFAFGEVKTSSEKKYPPGAMYGTTGLKQQLEDLKDKDHIRRDLILYLAHRAQSASWKKHFINAFVRYTKNNADVSVFGVLVRDVEPHEDDLRARVNALAKIVPAGMKIELLAVYLPPGCIPRLGNKLVNSKTTGRP